MRHLILGLGSMGRRHLSILRNLRPDDEFFTYDSDPDLGPTDDRPRADHIEGSCVYICTPTRWHQIYLNFVATYSPRAVFIEKPLFGAGASEIEWSGPPIDFPLAVGFQYRFHPVFRRLLYRSDAICDYHIYASDHAVARYPDPPLETLLAHPIATSAWLFGDMAEYGTVNDSGHAQFYAVSQSGVNISMSADTLSRQRVSLVIVDGEVIDVPPDESMYVAQMKAWLNYVETGERGDLCGWEEALRVQELLR